MSEVIREAIVRVGVDLAKRLIQVHAVGASGRVLVTRALPREKFLEWCAELPSGCVVAMEACSGAHHWGRQLQRLGLVVRLIAGHFVTPYRMQGKRGKNDANDAAAICECASRPHMRFVPVKSLEQQAILSVHRLREGCKEERTACINRIRGQLAEFGLVFAKSPEALRAALPMVIEVGGNGVPDVARLALQRLLLQWAELDVHMAWCEERITAHARGDAKARVAMKLFGIGPIGASAAVATVGEFEQFDNARQLGSWMGLVPSQDSSGGRTRLGGVHKRGDTYLRTLLVQGARSAVQSAHRRDDRLSRWVVSVRERRGWQKAAVALANKNARILWALLTKGECYDPEHVPAIPASKRRASPAACGAPGAATVAG